MKNYYLTQDYFGKTHKISLDPYNLFLTKVRNQLACLDQFEIRKRIAPNKVNNPFLQERIKYYGTIKSLSN
jgi:hypothetical protein